MTNQFVVVGVVVEEAEQIVSKGLKGRMCVHFKLGQPKPKHIDYQKKSAWDIFEITCWDGLAHTVLKDVKRRQWLCVTGHLVGNAWYNSRGKKIQRSVQMIAEWIDAPAQWRNPWIENPPSPWPTQTSARAKARGTARKQMRELQAVEEQAKAIGDALPEDFVNGLGGLLAEFDEATDE